MIRVTTNGVLRSYKSSLMRSSNNLTNARNKVLTQRNFNSYAEDPAAAMQSFQLRRAASRTSDQFGTTKNLISKFESAYLTVGAVVKDLGASANSSILDGLNDPTGHGRQALGTNMQQIAESIVLDLNTKYGDSYMFAGADGKSLPFSWSGDKLMFRGLDVSDPNNEAALKEMAGESVFVDIGLGLQEDATGKLLPTSAYNSALSGLNFLGYGVDSDGDPKNVAVIVKELGDILARCKKDTTNGKDQQDGEWASTQDKEDAIRLQQKLDTALTELSAQHVDVSTKSSFLKSNQTRLEGVHTTLNEQILGLEQIDLADAISSFSWAQYCYNAALKVGNSILSESLIDYMR